jgi:hypothetical protein
MNATSATPVIAGTVRVAPAHAAGALLSAVKAQDEELVRRTSCS